ncbi:putative ubiquitin-conjugating enzyme E2 16 [Capsicum annuum]|uniref:Ubiquitin-conjugating enzyme E2 16 n=1 Tax=Capsicum annuum TaxID=4072 RepID=A0A2G2ZP77_CAPAN|nr:putative ubiquitin-conjugating enzyme E2 16 [Capsicum annuum]
MEMVARILEKHLKIDQREFLMNSFQTVYGDETKRSMAEALGLNQKLTTSSSSLANILYDSWSPAMIVSSICISILSMLSSSTVKQRPKNNDRYVKNCRNERSPKETRYANEDVSLGSWFIGLDVEHIDEQSLCCGTPLDLGNADANYLALVELLPNSDLLPILRKSS